MVKNFDLFVVRFVKLRVVLFKFRARFGHRLIEVGDNHVARGDEVGNRRLSGRVVRLGGLQLGRAVVDRVKIRFQIDHKVRGLPVVTRLRVRDPSVEPFAPVGEVGRLIVRILNGQIERRRRLAAVVDEIGRLVEDGRRRNGDREFFRFNRVGTEIIFRNVPRNRAGLRVDNHAFGIFARKRVFDGVRYRRGRRFRSGRRDSFGRLSDDRQGKRLAGFGRLRRDRIKDRNDRLGGVVTGVGDHNFKRLFIGEAVGIRSVFFAELFRRFHGELKDLRGNFVVEIMLRNLPGNLARLAVKDKFGRIVRTDELVRDSVGAAVRIGRDDLPLIKGIRRRRYVRKIGEDRLGIGIIRIRNRKRERRLGRPAVFDGRADFRENRRRFERDRNRLRFN